MFTERIASKEQEEKCTEETMTPMRVSIVSFVVWTASTTAEYQPEFEPWHLAARNQCAAPGTRTKTKSEAGGSSD